MSKNLKSFRSFTEEKTKPLYFTWGRFQPPTTGHALLFDVIKKKAGKNQYRIYTTQSNDPKRNPLSYNDKIKFLRKMYPQHGRNIIEDKNIKMLWDIAVKTYKEGFTQLNMVVGSDRVQEFQKLLPKWNGKEARHGYYNFKDGINIISAGERDPDANDVTGMSGTKLRGYVQDNNFEKFLTVMPKGFGQAKELFNTIRKGMGLKESNDLRTHVNLDPTPLRERYVRAEVFNVGDLVKSKKDGNTYVIVGRHTNHVDIASNPIKENLDKTFKAFITDLEETSPPLEGTDNAVQNRTDSTPNEDGEWRK